MSADFDRESRALLAAFRREKVAWSDVALNYDLKQATAGSANHRLGSNPAWGLECLRVGSRKEVGEVLAWYRWLCTQPLDENETLTRNPAYASRIAMGTYAGALLGELPGEPGTADLIAERCRAHVAWCILGAAAVRAKKLGKANPTPPTKGYRLTANGPDLPAPYICRAGKRSWVREELPGKQRGAFNGLDDGVLTTLVCQALDLPYNQGSAGDLPELYVRLKALAPRLAHWGLSVMDAEAARAFLRNPTDTLLAREVVRWIARAPLPRLPVSVVRRESGAVEFALRRIDGSSTGALAVEVVLADGTRHLGSADTGGRGSEADRAKHVQSQIVDETDTAWVCRWASGQGVTVEVPRPPASDRVAWQFEVNEGDGYSFAVPGVPEPTPAPPKPPKPPKPNRPSWIERMGL